MTPYGTVQQSGIDPHMPLNHEELLMGSNAQAGPVGLAHLANNATGTSTYHQLAPDQQTQHYSNGSSNGTNVSTSTPDTQYFPSYNCDTREYHEYTNASQYIQFIYFQLTEFFFLFDTLLLQTLSL